MLGERGLSFKYDMVEILTLVKDLKLVDRQAQKNARNFEEFIDYLKNVDTDDES